MPSRHKIALIKVWIDNLVGGIYIRTTYSRLTIQRWKREMRNELRRMHKPTSEPALIRTKWKFWVKISTKLILLSASYVWISSWVAARLCAGTASAKSASPSVCWGAESAPTAARTSVNGSSKDLNKLTAQSNLFAKLKASKNNNSRNRKNKNRKFKLRLTNLHLHLQTTSCNDLTLASSTTRNGRASTMSTALNPVKNWTCLTLSTFGAMRLWSSKFRRRSSRSHW